MKIEDTPFISFDDQPKIKSWIPPEGIYNAIFRDAKRDKYERLVLQFEITSLKDTVYEYWVGNGYRDEDRERLNLDLLSWLGREQYEQLIRVQGIHLGHFFGMGADIKVECIDTGRKEALRVIRKIAPLGSLLPIFSAGKMTVDNSKSK